MKAILVFDVDEFTYEAINDYFSGVITLHMGNDGFIDFQNVLLQPMPKKMEVDVEKIEDIMHTEIQLVDAIQDKIIADIKLETDKLISLGWNGCIDKILGEEE